MAKKEIILAILGENKIVENTEKTLHTIFDQIKIGDEDDKELVEKVDKLKVKVSEQLPKFIEETYLPEYELAFTEEELQKMLDESRTELGIKIRKFNEELAVKVQPKNESWMQTIAQEIFAELFS